MTKLFWQLWKTTPAVIGVSILVAQAPIVAQTLEESNFTQAIPSAEAGSYNSQVLDLIDQYGEIEQLGALETLDSEDPMGQINNAFQLRDLDPNHWAFEAVRNLVEKYQCLSGFEDGTFRGELRLNRYQFAAALSKCLASIEKLIETKLGSSLDDGTRQIPLDEVEQRQITRLLNEFEAELAVLDARVDDGERKVERLEDQQFSTTTKLKGAVLFTLAGAFGDRQAVPSGSTAIGDNLDDNITFSDRVRLNFQTSFTGKDLLRTRLQAGNFVRLDDDVTGTDSTRLGHDADGNNNVELNDLWYRFPVGDKIRVHVGANELGINNVFNVLNPYLASSDTGGLSRFGRRNPLLHRGPDGAGVGINYKIDDQFKISALYLADDGLASNPGESSGLFNGGFSAGVQLDYAPTEDVDLAFTYLHSYEPGNRVNISSSTGSQFASNPFLGGPADPLPDTSSDRFGVAGNWKASDQVNIGGWFGLALANLETQFQNAPSDPSATIITWSINVAFPDLGGEGNVGGLIFGLPPKVTQNDAPGREDQDSSFFIEALYKYKVNKNIFVTPGFFVLLNPENNENNDTIFVGALRTTFKF